MDRFIQTEVFFLILSSLQHTGAEINSSHLQFGWVVVEILASPHSDLQNISAGM